MTELTMRRPTLDDVEQVLALMIRCDIADSGRPDTDLEDLTYDWGAIDLERDAWLLFAPKDELVGYAAALPWGDDARLDIYAEPDWPDDTLAADLLARALARAREMAAGRSQEMVARTFVTHSNRRNRQIAARAGFEPGRYIFQMIISLDRRPQQAQWPDDLTVRNVIPGQDDHQLHRLIQDAFYQPGREPQSFEDWREVMMRPDIFEPELWFLVLQGQEMVGACLAIAYSTGGWVRQLAVAEEWRGRGLGKALLLTAFNAFHARGFADVGLSVESKRPDAHSFYQAVGMRQLRQYDEYLIHLG